MAAAFMRAAETCETERVREAFGPQFPSESDSRDALARPEAGDPALRSDCAPEMIDRDVYMFLPNRVKRGILRTRGLSLGQR